MTRTTPDARRGLGDLAAAVDASETLKIGQVARAAGLTVETVRYYEKRGLLSRVKRRRSGYREFDAESMRRLRFIQRAKDLGFTLREIGDLLALRVGRTTSCTDVRERALAKMVDIEVRVVELRRVHAALGRLAASCGDGAPGGACPFLDALAQDDEA